MSTEHSQSPQHRLAPAVSAEFLRQAKQGIDLTNNLAGQLDAFSSSDGHITKDELTTLT